MILDSVFVCIIKNKSVTEICFSSTVLINVLLFYYLFFLKSEAMLFH